MHPYVQKLDFGSRPHLPNSVLMHLAMMANSVLMLLAMMANSVLMLRVLTKLSNCDIETTRTFDCPWQMTSSRMLVGII